MRILKSSRVKMRKNMMKKLMTRKKLLTSMKNSMIMIATIVIFGKNHMQVSCKLKNHMEKEQT
eukprot:380960-Ditylum_brightwellii.AAC.1